MSKLTDTQLVVLSAAAQRDDGALFPLPASLSLNGSAVAVVFESLLRRSFVFERPAMRGEHSWREAEGIRQTLVITNAGLEAIGIGEGDSNPAGPEASGAATASAGQQAVDPSAKGMETANAAAGRTVADVASPIRNGTKLYFLIELIKRQEGATISEAMAVTGWQAHSVRGAISGSIKKKHSLAVVSAPVEGRGRVYRIARGA
jgi:hypothetical protein